MSSQEQNLIDVQPLEEVAESDPKQSSRLEDPIEQTQKKRSEKENPTLQWVKKTRAASIDRLYSRPKTPYLLQLLEPPSTMLLSVTLACILLLGSLTAWQVSSTVSRYTIEMAKPKPMVTLDLTPVSTPTKGKHP